MKARRDAVAQARRVAFEAAVESLDVAIAGDRLEAARGAVEVWTSAYRVLEFGPSMVRVEVDVDVARLRKRLMPPTKTVGRPILRLAGVEASSACPGELADPMAWGESLTATGLDLRGDAPRSVTLVVECRPLGEVLATHLHAHRVVVAVEVQDGGRWREEGIGFALTSAEAGLAAREEAMTRIGPQLVEAVSGTVSLRVGGVGDGSRVRRLERAILEGVVGVRRVYVAGIEAGGVVRLAVEGVADAVQLAQGLSRLRFPDFSLELSALEPAAERGPERGTPTQVLDVELR